VLLSIVTFIKKSAVDKNMPNMTAQTCDTHYSVHYKFDGDFSPIGQWLSQNCSGRFEYSIERESRVPGQMVDVILQFEKEVDRAKFKDMILAGHTR